MPSVAPRGRGRRTISEINMVPFIDVMLVLLIIFMVTAPLIAPSVIDLPSVGKANKTPDRVVQVLIGKDEGLQVRAGDKAGADARAVTPDGLVAAVHAAQAGDANSPVVISADRSVRYETVVKVMDRLQRAGVQRLGLSVQLTP